MVIASERSANGAIEASHAVVNRRAAEVAVAVITAILGLFMTGAGVWALGWPRSFAKVTGYPFSGHFIHDAGAFQIGIGVGLLLALIWRDAIATVLACFLVANSIHAVNHVVDLRSGGHDGGGWLIGAVSVLAAVALWLRIRQGGWVVGHVGTATDPQLVRFVEQKTVLLTSYRRDGTPVRTPLSLAVDGHRAVFRTYERAWKTRRLRRDPGIELAPCTATGRPTGPGIGAIVRRLDGREAVHAAKLLRGKQPLLHGLTVPLAHRLGRAKTGRTVHFEAVPATAIKRQEAASPRPEPDLRWSPRSHEER
jgi:PPOX class probable F420-dependent enzyme